jgi:hypothetical protein
MNRFEFFKKHGNVSFNLPKTDQSYCSVVLVMREFEEFEKKTLPVIRTAFFNAREINKDKWLNDIKICPCGEVRTPYQNYQELEAEFFKRKGKQAEYVAMAFAPLI